MASYLSRGKNNRLSASLNPWSEWDKTRETVRLYFLNRPQIRCSLLGWLSPRKPAAWHPLRLHSSCVILPHVLAVWSSAKSEWCFLGLYFTWTRHLPESCVTHWPFLAQCMQWTSHHHTRLWPHVTPQPNLGHAQFATEAAGFPPLLKEAGQGLGGAWASVSQPATPVLWDEEQNGVYLVKPDLCQSGMPALLLTGDVLTRVLQPCQNTFLVVTQSSNHRQCPVIQQDRSAWPNTCFPCPEVEKFIVRSARLIETKEIFWLGLQLSHPQGVPCILGERGDHTRSPCITEFSWALSREDIPEIFICLLLYFTGGFSSHNIWINIKFAEKDPWFVP